ncbi:OmpH family outer membrane protein [Stenotrophomonas sp. STM01]|uniref:OmpH family outer membrane protein n=1 Tax=Stenotrophomonas sp. STM01 TaxID=2769278 RepID=UPI00177F5786|nr:OmpH family outer membrane protein [Stenotrophomonas sp. STM01]MBD9534296.1 OmpH family outer membrane protein [Stenotrophomonas sp. STM01]
MNSITRVLLLGVVLLSLSPLAGHAQTATPPLGGPVVQGVCMISREAIFANAKAGLSATEQLQRLTTRAQEQLGAEQATLTTELQALGLAGAPVQESQLTATQRAGLQKHQALQQKAAEQARQIEQARVKALQRISEEAQPLIAQVYARHNCGLLLDRNVVLGGNMANDLTAEVVQALDSKLTTVPVSIEAAPAGR